MLISFMQSLHMQLYSQKLEKISCQQGERLLNIFDDFNQILN